MLEDLGLRVTGFWVLGLPGFGVLEVFLVV